MSYGKMNYSRGALKFNVFTNIVDANAPNLLLADPATGKPIQLNFKTQTFDVEASHATLVGRRHALTYGGNFRRNNFDITLTPASKNRNEIGAYGQDEIILDRQDPLLAWRARRQVRQPRECRVLAAARRDLPAGGGSLAARLVQPRVPFAVAGEQLPRPAIVTPADSERACAAAAAGSAAAGGHAVSAGRAGRSAASCRLERRRSPRLKQESLTAYEVAYTGTVRRKDHGRRRVLRQRLERQHQLRAAAVEPRSVHVRESAARLAAAAVDPGRDGAARHLSAADGVSRI